MRVAEAYIQVESIKEFDNGDGGNGRVIYRLRILPDAPGRYGFFASCVARRGLFAPGGFYAVRNFFFSRVKRAGDNYFNQVDLLPVTSIEELGAPSS